MCHHPAGSGSHSIGPCWVGPDLAGGNVSPTMNCNVFLGFVNVKSLSLCVRMCISLFLYVSGYVMQPPNHISISALPAGSCFCFLSLAEECRLDSTRSRLYSMGYHVSISIVLHSILADTKQLLSSRILNCPAVKRESQGGELNVCGWTA